MNPIQRLRAIKSTPINTNQQPNNKPPMQLAREYVNNHKNSKDNKSFDDLLTDNNEKKTKKLFISAFWSSYKKLFPLLSDHAENEVNDFLEDQYSKIYKL